MASDGIASRTLILNEQLAQLNTFPYIESLITEDGECTTEFRTRLSRGQAIGHHCRKYGKSQHTDFNVDKTNESANVACSHIPLWKLDTQEERKTRLEAFEMKGLRKILRVSWTAKKTNEWVLNKAGVKKESLDTVKSRKLTYYGLTIRKQGNCLEKEIMHGTMPGVCRRGRPRTAWIDTSSRGQDSLWKS